MQNQPRGLNAQFWAIISVGIVIGGLVLQQSNSLRNEFSGIRGELGSMRRDIADLQERMTKVETTLNLIVQGLHIELRSGPQQ